MTEQIRDFAAREVEPEQQPNQRRLRKPVDGRYSFVKGAFGDADPDKAAKDAYAARRAGLLNY